MMMDRYLMPDSLAGRIRLPLHKTADLSEMVSSFLGTVAGAISQFVTDEIAKAKDDWVAAFAELAFEGVIGVYGGWFITLVDLIAEIGFNVKPFAIFKSIKDSLVEKLRAGGTIDSNTVKTAVDQHLGGSNADDHQIREAWERVGVAATIIKQAALTAPIQSGIKWLAEGPGKSIIEKLMGKNLAKGWIGRFFKWLFQTILGACSMFVKRKLVQKTFSGDTKPAAGEPAQQSAIPTPPAVPAWLKPSGFGTENQDPRAIWEEDVPLNTIGDTLVNWALQIYPQLGPQRGQLASSPMLKTIVNVIKSENSENHYPSITWMPHQFGQYSANSRKELVDLFVGDVASKMPEPEQQSTQQPALKKE